MTVTTPSPTAVPGLVDASMAVRVTPGGEVTIQVRPHPVGPGEHGGVVIEIVLPAPTADALGELVPSLVADAVVSPCAVGVRTH